MAASVPVTRSSDTVRSRLARNPLLVDALLAAGLTAVSLVTIAGGALDFGATDSLGTGLALLQTIPLVARRAAPVAVFAICLGALLGQAMFAGETFNSSIGALVALFTVAELRPHRVSAPLAVLAAASIAAVIIVRAGIPAGLAGLVQSVLTVFVVWVVGRWAQDRRRYIGSVEERAERAEHERELRAELAVTEERERIARELHDVVAHHVSVIVISAGAGLRSVERRPADAAAALRAIDESGRMALRDMRRMVTILGPVGPAGSGESMGPGAGEGGEVSGTGPVPAPMPGLRNLGELLERVRAAGLRTELAIVGEPRSLDPGLELTAYRITQEALTNTLKHVPDARAVVTVRYTASAFEVEIADDGGSGRGGHRGLAHPGEPGRGLVSMRERAALFGGTLEAGANGRGWRVTAMLPLEPSGARETQAAEAGAASSGAAPGEANAGTASPWAAT